MIATRLRHRELTQRRTATTAAQPSPLNVLRSLLIGVAVFTLAALTGALLPGSAPISEEPAPHGTPATGWVTSFADREPPEATTRATEHRTFARSMVYSGATGLTLSVAGLVMVCRRRRLW